MSAGRTIATFVVTGGVAIAIRRLPAPPLTGWQRTNYRGRSVSLGGGLATAAGALAGAAGAPGPGALRAAALVAGGSALLAGGYDDLLAPKSELSSDKGLAGHLRAIRSGRVSGGVVKVVLIGSGSLIASRLLPAAANRTWRRDLASAVLIAGSANLLNLFDLRPGRAAKVAAAVSTLSAVTGDPGPAIAVAAASLSALPDDLGERTMLGDLGANTLGALIGVQLAAGSPRHRGVALVVVGALTLASEAGELHPGDRGGSGAAVAR